MLDASSLIARVHNQSRCRFPRLVLIIKCVDKNAYFACITPLFDILIGLALKDPLYLGLRQALRSKLVNPFRYFVRVPV